MIDDDSDASPEKRPQHRHDSSDSEDDASPVKERPEARKATTARVVVDITRARDLSEEHGMPNPFCVLSIVQLRDGRRLSDAVPKDRRQADAIRRVAPKLERRCWRHLRFRRRRGLRPHHTTTDEAGGGLPRDGSTNPRRDERAPHCP